MLEPPDLGDDQLIGALEAGYGTRMAGLSFLPIGNDPASWSYRVEPAAGPARELAESWWARRGAIQALLAPGRGERSRRAAVDGFRSLFGPGNIVDLALLPPQW
jgi:hypothetical protein